MIDIKDLEAVPCAESSIVHCTFLSRTGAPFERMLDADTLNVGDIVSVHADGNDEIEHYIVTRREHALVLSDGGDVMCIFLTLNECIPNDERTER